jgi:hypothetical protein
LVLDRHHIILYVSLALALLAGTYLIADRKAETARTDLAVAKAQLVQTVSANRDFQAQVSAQLAQLQQENQALADALKVRQKVEVSIPAQNASLSASQVAQQIQTATKAKDGEVSATGDLLTLDLPLGQQALSALQLVPLLQQDKADLTVQVANDEKALQLEKESHASDVKALNAQIETDKVELKSVKATATRSKLRWFAAGVVVGFVGRGFAKL